MKHKRFWIECSKNYIAKIYRCPEYKNNFFFSLHWHEEYELIYIEKGPLKIQKLNGDVILNDNDVYFINSEEIHSYADITDDLSFVVINFPIIAISRYFENPNDCLKFNISDLKIKKKIADILYGLNECPDLNGRVEALKIKAILNDACFYLIKYCQAPKYLYTKGSQMDDYEAARTAIKYMEQNFRKDIPLSIIADYVGMTPVHFSKYFKEKTGATFSKYLRRIRIDHAIEDMRDNDISVKNAALNNGFPNVNSMIITCKTEYGKTPVEMKLYTKT